MPDPVVPQNEPQTPEPPNAEPTPPPSGAAPIEPPRNADGTFATPAPAPPAFDASTYRYPADHPTSWMAGKTPDEVAGLATQMYGAMVQGGQPPQALQPPQQQPPQQYTYQQAPTQPAPIPPGTPSTDWDDMNPAGSVDARINAATQQFQPVIGQQAEAIGQLSRAVAEQRNPDAFKRWGPEIDMELMRLQPDMKTEQNIKTIVDIVQGRHLGELQAEAAQKVHDQYRTGDLRADGATGAPAGAAGVLDLDRQVEAPLYKELLARHRITEATLRETFAKYPTMYAGNTFEEKVATWIAAANKGDVLTEQNFQIGE